MRWRQLYVNAEHDGQVGVVTLGRESYSWDVDAELNRALDWLKAEGIERVIVTGDFHISTQMVGADTSDFYPALEDVEAGKAITRGWSRTARRLHEDFRVSVAMVPGKRCLGGMLELLLHCHWLVAVEDARFGFPEVTLPVVPGMEGCHWALRKAPEDARPRAWSLATGDEARAALRGPRGPGGAGRRVPGRRGVPQGSGGRGLGEDGEGLRGEPESLSLA